MLFFNKYLRHLTEIEKFLFLICILTFLLRLDFRYNQSPEYTGFTQKVVY